MLSDGLGLTLRSNGWAFQFNFIAIRIGKVDGWTSTFGSKIVLDLGNVLDSRGFEEGQDRLLLKWLNSKTQMVHVPAFGLWSPSTPSAKWTLYRN